MEIAEDIYLWLRASNLIEESLASGHGTFLLSGPETENLIFGITFGKILTRSAKLFKKLSPDLDIKNSLSQIKSHKSSASKASNWKVIKSILKELQINTETDDIELIKSGSTEVLEMLLQAVFEFEQRVLIKIESSSYEEPVNANPRAQKGKSGELIIESLTADIPLQSTESCLEFLLVSFCKHFSLQPKQAAGLLTQSGRYLGYILSKGYKGKHDVIVQWYSDIYTNSAYLLELMIKELTQGGVTLIFSSLFPGLLSKSLNTVLWCARSLSKIASDLQKASSKASKHLWQWFSTTGFEACIQACKRFGSHVKISVVAVIIPCAQTRFREILQKQLQELIPEPIQYLATVHELLPLLLEVKVVKDELTAEGILQYFMQVALVNAEDLSVSADERVTAINLLCDLWVAAAGITAEDEGMANRILAVLERVSRDKSFLLKVTCLGKFFQILHAFTGIRNSFAPIIYKIITFSLIENYSDSQVKEFVLYNLINILDELPEIPLKIVIEPLTKHLKISTNLALNVADFAFFSVICQHPKLTFKAAIEFIDALMKLYAEHLHFCELIGDILLTVSERFIDIEPVQQYLKFLVKFCLKSIRESKTENPLKKAYMALTAGCLNLHCETLNQSLKFDICEVLVKITVPELTEWLMKILNVIGDPLEIVEEYKTVAGIKKKQPVEDKKLGGSVVRRKSRVIEEDIAAEKSRVVNQELPAIGRGKTSSKLNEFYKKNPDMRISVKRQDRNRRVSESSFSSKEEIVRQEEKILYEISMNDYELIQIMLKNNKKTLDQAFKKYSISHRATQKVDTFAGITESFNHITAQECFKLLKDATPPALHLPQTGFLELTKEYCSKHSKTKEKFNFIEFQDFLINCATVIYPDFFLYPPVMPALLLIENIENTLNDSSRSPAKITEIAKLSREIEKNPSITLPKGFKKIIVKDVKIVFEVPDQVSSNSSFRLCIELLDELLFASIKVHFLEPLVKVVDIYKIQVDFNPPKGQEVLPDLNYSAGIKYEIARLTGKYDPDLLAAASSVLNDLLNSLSYIKPPHSKSPVRSLNKFEKLKQLEQRNMKKEERLKEKKRVLRAQLVKLKVSKLLPDKNQKKLELKHKADREEARKRLVIRKLEEKIEQDRQARLEEVEKWRAKREESLKLKEQMELEKVMRGREVRIKKRDEFFESEKLRLKKLSEENFVRKTTMTKLQGEVQEREKAERLKKLENHKSELEKARKQKEEQEKMENEFREEFGASEVQAVFKRYEKALQLVFLHFCSSRLMPNDKETVETSVMEFKGFYRFGVQFKIVPALISVNDLKKLFIGIVKSQEKINMNYEGFMMLCFKISKISSGDSQKTALEVLGQFLNHLELPKDSGTTRNLLRKQETLRNSP